jgi:uncharacterized protein (DUF736 family)|tara:strand:+ start:787 stop:987 length:201 start_codon:yes stop_codon:yes gene_type:complete
MPFEPKDNTFAFFVNEKKSKDNQPDYTGQGRISGEDVKVAGWKKTSKKGLDFISCVVEKKLEDMPF